MMSGTVNSSGELMVPIRILDANEHIRRFEAIVDTGFTGDLTLPSEYTRELGLIMEQTVDAVVANEET